MHSGSSGLSSQKEFSAGLFPKKAFPGLRPPSSHFSGLASQYAPPVSKASPTNCGPSEHSGNQVCSSQ